MPTLLDLPTELILRVLAEVDPLDLIRMSRVCKAAFNILADRPVWEGAVRRLCCQNSLFEPSFQPLDSLNLEELRRAALRPYSFHAKMSNASRLYPIRERTLNYSVEESRQEDFVRVQIVPGGRYVIGLAYAYICLWDVGPPGTAPPPVLVDIFYSEFMDFNFLSMSPPAQSSKDSFSFAVHGDTGGQRGQRVQAFEVRPLQEGRVFRPLGSLCLDENEPVSRFWVSGNRLFLCRGTSLLIVWDFVCSTAISWILPEAPGIMPHCDLVNRGDMVVLLMKTEFYTCKIPTLRHMDPNSPFSASNFIVRPPYFRASYQFVPDPDFLLASLYEASSRDTLILPSNWTSADPHAPLIFDILRRRTLQFKRFELGPRASNDERDSGCRVVVSSEPGSPGLDSLLKQRRTRLYSTCGRGLYVMGAPSELGLSVAIHHSTFDAEEDPDWRTMEQCAVEHRLDVSSLICPFSGRFAYGCLNSHGDGYNMIHVVDLLD